MINGINLKTGLPPSVIKNIQVVQEIKSVISLFKDI